MFDKLLNVKQVASTLGVSVPTVWRHVANGKLPAPCKVGGASRWLESELVAEIERMKAERDGEAV